MSLHRSLPSFCSNWPGIWEKVGHQHIFPHPLPFPPEVRSFDSLSHLGRDQLPCINGSHELLSGKTSTHLDQDIADNHAVFQLQPSTKGGLYQHNSASYIRLERRIKVKHSKWCLKLRTATFFHAFFLLLLLCLLQILVVTTSGEVLFMSLQSSWHNRSV